MADDNELALGALATIAQGFAAAHSADVQFKMAELSTDIEREKIKSAENQQFLRYALEKEEQAISEYKNDVKKLDKFNIDATSITKAGTELVDSIYEDKTINVDAVMQNTKTWQERSDNIDSTLNLLKNQKADLDFYSKDFAGKSAMLNPLEFDKLKSFALTEDDPETDEIEGLNYGTKYPSLGTAGLDQAYSEIGTRPQIQLAEAKILENKIAKVENPFKANYTVFQQSFTPQNLPEDYNESDLEEANQNIADSYGMPLEVLTQLQYELRSPTADDFMRRIYEFGLAEGGQEFLTTLRDNPQTAGIFRTLEDSYDEILELNNELMGDDSVSKNVNFSTGLNNVESYNQALTLINTYSTNGLSFNELNKFVTEVGTKYGVDSEKIMSDYNNIYSPSEVNIDNLVDEELQEISSKESIKIPYSTEDLTIKNVYNGMDKEKRELEFNDSGIHVGKIFDMLDNIKIEGQNREEIQTYLTSLADKKSPNYNPAILELMGTMYNSWTMVGPQNFPNTSSRYLGESKEAFVVNNAFGLNQANYQGIFQNPMFYAGENYEDLDLGGKSNYLRDSAGEFILDDSGEKILAYEYFRGDDALRATLGNSMGLSKFNIFTEGDYLNSYNSSMEKSFDALRSELDYPGIDYLSSSAFTGEIFIGAKIKQEFGAEAYKKAHEKAKLKGREAQINHIKSILEEPGTPQYNTVINAMILMQNKINNPNKEYSDSENLKNLKRVLSFSNSPGTGSSNMTNTSSMPTLNDITENPGDLKSNLDNIVDVNAEVIDSLNALKNVTMTDSEYDALLLEWDEMTDDQKSEYRDFNDFLNYATFSAR